jgi:serine/threonine-protein kinase
VDAAVRKALEKLPADRFASPQEFVRALGDEHFRYGEAAVGVGGSATSPWNRLAIAMTLLAVVTTAVAAWATFSPDPPEGVLRYAVDVNLGRGTGLTGARLAISPDGTKLAYRGMSGGSAQLWVRDRHDLEPRM